MPLNRISIGEADVRGSVPMRWLPAASLSLVALSLLSTCLLEQVREVSEINITCVARVSDSAVESWSSSNTGYSVCFAGVFTILMFMHFHTHVFIHLFTYPINNLLICLFTHLLFHLSIYLFNPSFLYVPINPFAHLSVYLFSLVWPGFIECLWLGVVERLR